MTAQRIQEETSAIDRFGFLPIKCTIEFDGGKISPVPEFDTAWERVEKHLHEDGFLYPPSRHRVTFDPLTLKIVGRVPRTKRPLHLRRLPTSHELRLSHADTREALRDGPAAFIIHCLGFLYDVRLQFYDWWFDGRIPIGQACKVRLSSASAGHFLSHAYQVWKGWKPDEQRRFTNILYMRCRAPLYEWDWEKFMIEYMVIDGCWKMAEKLFHLAKSPHPERIRKLCDRFSTPIQKEYLRKITKLRGDLFHETLWDRGMPGFVRDANDAFAFRTPTQLRNLSRAFIRGLLGYND